MAIDTTVHHPIHASTHTTRGVGATAAEAQKVRFIRERYMISRSYFIPFVCETYGAYARSRGTRRAATTSSTRNSSASTGRASPVAVQGGNLVAI